MSPDRCYLLSNSRDNSLKLTDVRTYHEVRTYGGQGYRPAMNWARAAFSPDGNYIAAGSQARGGFAAALQRAAASAP